MSIQEIEEQIIDEFSAFEDWLDKYAYIIDLGRECTHTQTETNSDLYDLIMAFDKFLFI